MHIQTDGQTDGWWADFGTKLIYPLFLKKKAGITRFWLFVCVNIVKTFKCVLVFFSRNYLSLICNIEPLKRVLHFQHLTYWYNHIRKHWLLVDRRSRLYLANHALVVRRDCTVRKSVKYFQSHRIHTQVCQWYFAGKDDTLVSCSSIVCRHGIFVLVENQKNNKVVVW